MIRPKYKTIQCYLQTFSGTIAVEPIVEVLGVKPNCTLQEAKSAYYRQAQIYHPDKNPSSDAKEKFNRINEAYNTVVQEIQTSSSTTSSTYSGESTYTKYTDYTKYTSYESQQTSRDQGRQTKSSASSRWKEYYNNPSSFYEQQMYQMMKEYFRWDNEQRQVRKQQKQKQAKKKKEAQEDYQDKKRVKSEQNMNVTVNLELTNTEFRTGCTKEVAVKRKIPCQCCNNRKGTCKICHGTGVRADCFDMGLSFYESTCICMKQKRNPKCVICHGKGSRTQTHTQLVRIPRNSQVSQTLKVSGKGNRTQNSMGDLIITLIGKIKGDKVDFDLHSVETITVAEAVLGTNLQIQTLSGKLDVPVPRGFTSGGVISLKGLGYLKDSKKNVFGDHFVKVNIKTPEILSPKQQRLYKQILQLQKLSKKEC